MSDEKLALAPSRARRRRRARRGHGEELRDEIIAAAERLLVETGDERAVSIRAVADAVGVTPPSIYLHFADKTELIFAVCEKNFAHFDRTLEEAAAGSTDPLEALRLRGRAYVRFGLDHPEQYRTLFMRKASDTPKEWTSERLMGSLAFDHLVQAVQRCLDAGAIEPGNPMLIACGLWGEMHGITSLFIAKPDFPWPDRDGLVDHMIRVHLEGLRRAD